MKAKHTAAFTVHLHHIGPGGLARPSLIFDCFQDAASIQSAQLGFSIHDLNQRGLTWVVSRYRVHFLRYPRWRERIQVTTWRGPQQGLAVPREFVVKDADHATIILARGIFSLLDRSANRPVAPDDHLPDYPVADDQAFAGQLPKLPELCAADLAVPVHIRRDDLDLNHHVNNTRYIGFAMESVPPSIAQNHIPELIDVVFKASARHGDTLCSLIKPVVDQPLTFIHRLTDDQRNLTYANLVSRWRPTT